MRDQTGRFYSVASPSIQGTPPPRAGAMQGPLGSSMKLREKAELAEHLVEVMDMLLKGAAGTDNTVLKNCLLYTSPSPRDSTSS
eukprot:4596254-Prorocentrum_lima.AAC.1